MLTTTIEKLTCYHCGEDCERGDIIKDNHHFCCEGCKTVYELLSENNLCNYYDINAAPGTSLKSSKTEQFAYLDDPQVKQKLIRFTDGTQTSITLYIPKLHCSSCIWLLENLYKLHPGISKTQVNFLRREVSIHYLEEKISLRGVVELLAHIGYTPAINLNDLNKKQTVNPFKAYYFKLAVAFFCFGNMMMLSFPEYLGLDILAETHFRKYFGYLNFILSLPVLLYSAQEFFISAYTALKQRSINMDFPIVLGIIIMFIRSSWEIFSGEGAGYMDTLGSLIFLMLIGRMFQQKVYHRLSFDRDYKSYFPVAVTVIKNGEEISTPVSQLKPGDRMIIRNQELVPADAILFKGNANIDYSFVTGESLPIDKTLGEIVYAGGKQVGGAIELEVVKEVSQSYLTQLWNDQLFTKKQAHDLTTLSNRVSKTFTIVVLAIGFAAALYWARTDVDKAINAFTAVLIITCPCALALSTPFTLGNALRIFGRNKFYLKNGPVAEKLAKSDTIVFDKTGTITRANGAKIHYEGEALKDYEFQLLRSLAHQLNHPLSQKIYDLLPKFTMLPIEKFTEFPGKGAEAIIAGHTIKAGTAKLFPELSESNTAISATRIYISIDNNLKGHFAIRNQYREGFEELVNELKNDYELVVLSGDNDGEREHLQKIFNGRGQLLFHQTPPDKLSMIRTLQAQGKNVIMIGDGLNDAGALMQSDTGISISDDINNFSPACDAILDASQFPRLARMLRFSKASVSIIKASFIISFLYNVVGVWFAVQGTLSPLIAAILMPISSVTVILFTTVMSGWISHRQGFGR
jgi:Cu+-exporting ATPase